MRFVSIFTFDPTQRPSEPDTEMMAKMGALIGEMMASGTLIDTGGVTPTGMSLRVQSKGNGSQTVTDGPFAESKEIVGGYAVLSVKDREHLLTVTQRFLDCAGGGTCTIHEIAEFGNACE
jgi:hypothetical protein